MDGVVRSRHSMRRARELIRPACIGLHVLLAAAHLAILCTWATGAEHSTVFSPEHAASLTTKISLAAQAVIIVSTT